MRLSTDKLMLFGIVIFTLAEGLTHYGQVYPDSPSYFSAAHFFQGRVSQGPTNFRLLRPVIPFLASLMNYFVDIRTSFAVVNLVLWCASAALMFCFTKLLTKNNYASLFSSALFTSAVPMLIFADSALTDMGGYFFILLCTFLIVRWNIPHASLKRACLMGLILGIGVLTRESVASVLIFAIIWTILSKGSISRILALCLIPLAVSLAWSQALGVSYVTWYVQGGLAFAGVHQALSPLRRVLRILGSILYSFGRYPIVLAFAALGFLRIRDKDCLKIHISILIGAIAIIVAWPVIDTRFSFILFPSVFPLAGAGLADAYRIMSNNKFIQTTWPSFANSPWPRYALLIFVVAVCAFITNFVLEAHASFPWMPYTDPSVNPAEIR
jgi:4-amino-4-deoxy-L-arabinose transferase-like glycosyltransferase